MSAAWKWGQKPPKWFMKEFEKALYLMGKNKEAIHMFDTSPDWTFIIAISPKSTSDRTAKLIGDAIAGAVIESEHYYPGAPRQAVHGDLYN